MSDLDTLIVSRQQWDHARRDYNYPHRRRITRYCKAWDDDHSLFWWGLQIYAQLNTARREIARDDGDTGPIVRVTVAGMNTVRFGYLIREDPVAAEDGQTSDLHLKRKAPA